MQKIIIIGNSISADILYAYLEQDKRYDIVAFSVDESFIIADQKCGIPVVALETLSQVFSSDEHRVVMAVGYKEINKLRETLFAQVKAMGYVVETYIHPDAKVYNQGNIGEGSIIMANTVVEVHTLIGKNAVIWAGCVIGHHATVGDNCWIASGTVLAGEVTVGCNSFLGVNVTISNQVNVADFNIIGGHTAIHKHTKSNEVYICGQGEKLRFSADEYAEQFLK